MRVISNARYLGAVLKARGIALVGGGTDTHMVLVDLSALGKTGEQAERVLAHAGITSNKNPIPFDRPKPSDWSGLRLGVSAATTRGFGTMEMEVLGNCIADLILAESEPDQDSVVRLAKQAVSRLAMAEHPQLQTY